jgi:hypothetical protein
MAACGSSSSRGVRHRRQMARAVLSASGVLNVLLLLGLSAMMRPHCHCCVAWLLAADSWLSRAGFFVFLHVCNA